MVLVVLLAGILPDIDWFSSLFGPTAYLAWHRASAHSLVLWPVLALVAVMVSFLMVMPFGAAHRRGAAIALGMGDPSSPGAAPRTQAAPEVKPLFPFMLLASLCSMLLHLFLDFCQADGVVLLWPFSSRRFALDLLPGFDLWLLIILASAILLPELFLLVGEEIGSRATRPRGRNGALTGLACAAAYLCLRFLVHGNAVASLESHSVAREMPRRVGAFPDSTSPFLWHGVVETQSTLNLLDVRSAGGEVTEASGVTTLHKPEPSPMLAAAQSSPAAIVFLKSARFPKATVENESDGYSVEIHDVKDQATGEKGHAIFAYITLDKRSDIVSSELQWLNNSQKP
jgi:inner membrane protein